MVGACGRGAGSSNSRAPRVLETPSRRNACWRPISVSAKWRAGPSTAWGGFAAGPVGLESGDMLWNLGGGGEPGGEDCVRSLDLVSKVRGEVHHPEGGRRGGAARIRGIRGEGRAGRGTALEVLPSVRRRTERGGTGMVAGGTAGACGSRMDGRAEHVVRHRAGRGVMGCEAGGTVRSFVERRHGRGKLRSAVGCQGLMGTRDGRGCNIIQALGGTGGGGGRRRGGSAWHCDRRRAGRRVGAAAMRGEVAPGLAVHTVDGEAPDGMWWFAAGRVRPESGGMVSSFWGGATSVVEEIGSADAAAGAGVRRRASRAAVEGDEGVGWAAAESVEDGGVLGSEGDDAAAGADVRRRERCHAIVVDNGAVRAAVVSAIGVRVWREGPRRPSIGWVRHFVCFLVAPMERSGGSFSEGKTRPAVLYRGWVEEELLGGRWWRFSGTGGPRSS